jgi:ribulose 1,5-bisphosphate synthetase/thiazole synthase
MRKLRFLFTLTILTIQTACAVFAQKQTGNTFEADVIVYGGTCSAVTAAVQVAKSGKTVLVVSPDKHLGGLSSGGLGFTDTGNKAVIGGLAREFYHRVFMHYDKPEAWQWQKKEEYGNKGQGTPAMDGADRTMWIFEPPRGGAGF